MNVISNRTPMIVRTTVQNEDGVDCFPLEELVAVLAAIVIAFLN